MRIAAAFLILIGSQPILLPWKHGMPISIAATATRLAGEMGARRVRALGV